MPTASRRQALYLALAVIAGNTAYRILLARSAPALPDTFAALVLKIAIVKVVVLSVVGILLRLGGEPFAGALGLHREGWKGRVMAGLGFGVVLFLLFNVFLSNVMQQLLPDPPSNSRSIASFFNTPANLIAWLPIGIFGGGVVEELERIFIITRFEQWLGRSGLIVGVMLSSFLFGIGHLYQGRGAAVATGLAGLTFALIYLRRRSAIEPIVAHAFSDVLAILGVTLMGPS